MSMLYTVKKTYTEFSTWSSLRQCSTKRLWQRFDCSSISWIDPMTLLSSHCKAWIKHCTSSPPNRQNMCLLRMHNVQSWRSAPANECQQAWFKIHIGSSVLTEKACSGVGPLPIEKRMLGTFISNTCELTKTNVHWVWIVYSYFFILSQYKMVDTDEIITHVFQRATIWDKIKDTMLRICF